MLWVEIPVRAADFLKTPRAYRAAGAWGAIAQGRPRSVFLLGAYAKLTKFTKIHFSRRRGGYFRLYRFVWKLWVGVGACRKPSRAPMGSIGDGPKSKTSAGS